MGSQLGYFREEVKAQRTRQAPQKWEAGLVTQKSDQALSFGGGFVCGSFVLQNRFQQRHQVGGVGDDFVGTELTGTPLLAINLHKSEEQRQNLSRS